LNGFVDNDGQFISKSWGLLDEVYHPNLVPNMQGILKPNIPRKVKHTGLLCLKQLMLANCNFKMCNVSKKFK